MLTSTPTTKMTQGSVRIFLDQNTRGETTLQKIMHQNDQA